ncbi:VF530 family protein [Chitinimonas naiadis]
MSEQQANNPSHGITLEKMLTSLVEHYGWPELGKRIAIRCFLSDPNIKSSLTFLRRTPWAREKVEQLYAKYQRSQARQKPPASED